MAFEARLFIQGVANFVPHENERELLVLFPDQGRYDEREFPSLPSRRGDQEDSDEEVCPHAAVVQMDARHLTGGQQDALRAPWATFHVERHWIGIDSDSGVAMNLTGGRVPGLPLMQTVLDAAGVGALGELDPRALPSQGDEDPPDDLILSGLYLKNGKVSPASDFEGSFTFHRIKDIRTRDGGFLRDAVFSSVIKVELGEVSRLSLLLRPFGSAETGTVDLRPIGDELDVWIRHFCSTAPPDPYCGGAVAGSVDADFVLNYLPRRDLQGFLKHAGDELPIPKISESWLRGGPIGGDPCKCMGSCENGGAYSPPIAFG